jgi:hypothetical protein
MHGVWTTDSLRILGWQVSSRSAPRVRKIKGDDFDSALNRRARESSPVEGPYGAVTGILGVLIAQTSRALMVKGAFSSNFGRLALIEIMQG